jgi:hypothetical protein
MTSIFPYLRRAVQYSSDGIARLIDPDTNEQFVVMSAESYQQRVQHVFDVDGTPAAETVAFQFPFDDKNKNEGSLFYGSLGRAEVLDSANPVQQRVRLADKQPLLVDRLILTISDDALTNPLQPGDSDDIDLR